jgi:hypothetical protein
MLAPVHLGPMKPHRHQLGRAKEIAQSLIRKEDAHFLQSLCDQIRLLSSMNTSQLGHG